MEASWWEKLRWKLGFVLMGRAMLSKSVIQFSVDGWGCVPSLLFPWGQTMTSLVAQTVKHLPTMWDTWIQSLGWEDLLEKEREIHSSILAWKIPWMEEPGGLQSKGSQRVRHDWATSLNYGGGNEDNGDLLQKVPCMPHCTQCPQPCSRPLPTHASARDSWTLRGKSGSASCGVTAPFS